MRNRSIFLLMALLALCLCVLLTACDGGEGDVTTPTLAPTEAPTQPEEDATEAPTDGEVTTETPTEETTEVITEAAEPSLMTVIDLDAYGADHISTFFARTSKCDIELATDEAEGKVIRVTTKGISSPGTAAPTTLFELADLVASMNGIMPKTTEYPHLVMKVKAKDLWSRNLSYFGGENARDAAATDGKTRMARISLGEDWQYIYLDLTACTTDWKVFYLAFEQAAGKNGETLEIAELHFFATAAEAEALCPAMADTYPIVEQTLDDYTLKVMSFNVQTENGTSVSFDLRAEMLRDLLDQLRPDSIGMQEVTTGWINRMNSFAFNNSYAGVGEGRTPGGEASSIYYRKDKFELVDSGTFWLSDTPDVQGSAFANANYPRICTWVHLRDKATGFEYIHINTHLDHNGNNSSSDGRALRTSQVRVLLEYIQKFPDVPMVLTGDFNQAKTNGDEEIYAMFKNVLGISSFTATTGEKMTGNFADARADAADTVPADAWASMTSYWQEGTDKYNPAKKPIDYVFYTPDDFDAMVYRNIHYHRDGIYMSDHLPQYCELHVKVAAEQNAD